jgi:hypothetical protein
MQQRLNFNSWKQSPEVQYSTILDLGRFDETVGGLIDLSFQTVVQYHDSLGTPDGYTAWQYLICTRTTCVRPLHMHAPVATRPGSGVKPACVLRACLKSIVRLRLDRRRVMCRSSYFF